MVIAVGKVYESTVAAAIPSLYLLVASEAAVTMVTSGTRGNLNCIAVDGSKVKQRQKSAGLKKDVEILKKQKISRD